jgi:pimeloyl-ACP methyl ester carboxylesterase
MVTALAAGIDTVALRAARRLLDAAVMPGPEAAAALRAESRFYADLSLARFCPFVGAPPPPPLVRATLVRSRVAARERLRVAFPSSWRTANPDAAPAPLTPAANDTVHAEVWRHRDRRPTATVVALHGFGMGNPTLDAIPMMAPALFALGLDVALFTLPLHGARTPAASRFSGQAFTTPSVAQINEAIGQAAHDVAAIVHWLADERGGPVGLLGVSLGGYVAAFMAALLPELAFVIPVVAPACFGDLAWRFMAASRLYRGGPPALDRDELRAAFRIHSPLAHPLRVPRSRLLIAAGRGDRVVPPEHAEWLAAHWDAPAVHWFAGSHLAPFGRRGVIAAIGRFLAGLGLAAA